MPTKLVPPGFSLVELMVGMTVSLILLAGIAQIFIGSKQTYRVQEANSRLQESGRSAIALLQRDIRPAGFQGCRSLRALTPNVIANSPMPSMINANTVIMGYQKSNAGAWSPSSPAITSVTTLPSATRSAVANGTDVLTIQGASECADVTTSTPGSVTANPYISIGNRCNIGAGTVMILADCSNADIFRVSSTSPVPASCLGCPSSDLFVQHAATHNSTASFSKIFLSLSDITPFQSYSYFIAPGSGSGPSLWRYDNTSAANATATSTTPANPLELVTEVQDMQVEYGQDSSGDGIPNYYVPADSVANWGSVVSLRISLLISSAEDNVVRQAQSYRYNRNNVTASDKRLYKVFTTTILLRNGVS